MFRVSKKRPQQQNHTVTQEPKERVIYVQERKQGCLSGCAKWIGFGVMGVIAIVVIAAALGLSGESDEPVTSDGEPRVGSGENPAEVGSSIMGDGLEVTVHSVSESDTGGVLSPAEPGWTYLTLDVTVRNVSDDDNKSVNPLYFSAKDIENGYTFDDDLFGGDPAASLGSTNDLLPGDLMRGEVVLKVRDVSQQVRIKYDTSPIGGKNLYWLYER